MKRLSVLVACVIVSVWVSDATAQPATFTVTSTDGLVTLRASNAPLAEIFESLVSKGIVEVTGMDRLAGVVSVDIERRPVDAVVTALLADYNFVVTTPRVVAGRPAPAPRVRIHSLRDPSAVAKGPISIPELRALRAADLEADLPDPVDPDSDPEEQAEAREAAEEHAAEEAERIAEVTERERAGAFDRRVSVETLAELLDEDNPRVRARALTELNARDSTDALAALLKGFDDEDSVTRYHAVDLLSRRADAASLEQVGALLVGDQADPGARYCALMVIAARADRSSVSFVESVADDKDPLIKASAATLLRELARRAQVAAPANAQKPPPPSDIQ
jgi:HEAT repeats